MMYKVGDIVIIRMDDKGNAAPSYIKYFIKNKTKLRVKRVEPDDEYEYTLETLSGRNLDFSFLEKELGFPKVTNWKKRIER